MTVEPNQLRHMFGDANRSLRDARQCIGAIAMATDDRYEKRRMNHVFNALGDYEQAILRSMKELGIPQDGVSLGYEGSDD